MESSHITTEIVTICKGKLIEMRARLLNQALSYRRELMDIERGSGDEADLTVAQIAEDHFLLTHDRIRTQLYEIDQALHRIEAGTFGICEETSELIESERLLALPHTRLSIEGAEIREAVRKRLVP